jgi:hypothetical protein
MLQQELCIFQFFRKNKQKIINQIDSIIVVKMMGLLTLDPKGKDSIS